MIPTIFDAADSIRSEECLESIYRSTTFIFTDVLTIQMFFGSCHIPEVWKAYHMSMVPPAFFRYAQHVELSLQPHFPMSFSCANRDLPGVPHRHEVYDFHWLRLDQFDNLQSLKLWIASRSPSGFERKDLKFLGIKQFDLDGLKSLMARFAPVKSVTLSTPLSSVLGPEEGDVEGLAVPGVRVYKRGSGDRFHPFLWMLSTRGAGSNRIHTCAAMYVELFTLVLQPLTDTKDKNREVRLGYNGGNYILMQDV